MGARDDAAGCAMTAHRIGHPALKAAQAAHRAAIFDALVAMRQWLALCDSSGLDMVEVFGISREEVVEAQRRHWEPLEAEKAEIEEMLR